MAYEFAFIVQSMAASNLPPYYHMLGYRDNPDEHKKAIVEAQVAKLELRGKFGLSDAVKILEKHAGHHAIKL